MKAIIWKGTLKPEMSDKNLSKILNSDLQLLKKNGEILLITYRQQLAEATTALITRLDLQAEEYEVVTSFNFFKLKKFLLDHVIYHIGQASTHK